jgi:hypothetical protein
MNKFLKDRAKDTNLSCAVGERDSYEFTVFKEPALSTVNREWKEKFILEGNKVNRIDRVSGRRLRSIYDEYFGEAAVDLLNIDAEGADFEILQSMDFATLPLARFPRYIMVESVRSISESVKSLPVKFAIDFGYEPLFVLPFSTILKRIGL